MEFVRGESVGRFHGGLFTAMIATMLRSAAFSETVRTCTSEPQGLATAGTLRLLDFPGFGTAPPKLHLQLNRFRYYSGEQPGRSLCSP